MGYGPVINGKQHPITHWKGSWAATVNEPIPERVKKAHQDQFPATSSHRLVMRYDKEGRRLS